MRALITGGFGFAGRHLSQYLVSCGDDVALTYHPKHEDGPKNEDGFLVPVPKSIQSFALDVADKSAVSQLFSLTQPDVIYHLAAMTFVPDAEKDPTLAYDVNLQGSLNVLEAVKQHVPKSRVLVVSSSEVYGEPRPGALPVTELSELRPITNYGATKTAADRAAHVYAYRNHLDVVVARPFPHIGPGQSDRFAISSFCRQVAEIKLGKAKPVLKVGNLEARRDYSDVSDIVRGYREAALNGKRSEAYNLCSGLSREIGEILKTIIKVGEVEVEVVQDPGRYREVDIADIYGEYAKAKRDFGWRPRIEFEATLSSLFSHWLESLS